MKTYFFSFTIIVIIAESFLILSYDYDKYAFCYSSDCIEFFLDEFYLAIKFPIAALSLAVAVAALVKLSIAHQTYLEQATSSKITNSLNHLDHFKNIVSFHADNLDRLREVPISFAMLHAAFFPEISLSDDEPKKALERWKQIVQETTERVEREGLDAFAAVEYRRQIEPLMRSVGISISEDVENGVFFEIEKQCYKLLGEIGRMSKSVSEFTVPSYVTMHAGS